MANFFNASRPDDSCLQVELIPPEKQAFSRRRAPFFREPVSDADFYDLGPADSLADDDGAGEAPVKRAPSGASFVHREPYGLLPRLPDRVELGVRSARSFFWTGVVVLSAASFWLAGGHALAERMKADPPLTISAVETRILDSGGVSVIVVEGWVKNSTGKARDLPFLLLETGDGVEPVAVDTGRSRLEPGESVSFTGRIAMPSRGDASLRISFADGKRLAALAS